MNLRDKKTAPTPSLLPVVTGLAIVFTLFWMGQTLYPEHVGKFNLSRALAIEEQEVVIAILQRLQREMPELGSEQELVARFLQIPCVVVAATGEEPLVRGLRGKLVFSTLFFEADSFTQEKHVLGLLTDPSLAFAK